MISIKMRVYQNCYVVLTLLCLESSLSLSHSSRFAYKSVSRTSLSCRSTLQYEQESTLDPDEMNKNVLIKEIVQVGVPAIAACVAEPLLSIVDTIFIGKLAITVSKGVTDLAAMSINNAIFNVLAALTYPLCTGTTNLVAIAQGKHENTKKNVSSALKLQITPESYLIFLNGLIVSSSIGVLFYVITYFSGNRFIEAFFHPESTVSLAASEYFRIRMISFPFGLMNYVLVGFSLGTQSMLAPVASIAASFLVNVLGDYLFIKELKMGIAGAAWATTLSSIIGTMLGIFLIGKSVDKQTNNAEDLDTVTPAQVKVVSRHSFKRILQLLDWTIIRSLFSTSGLILTGSLLNTLTYSALAKISSTYKPPSTAASSKAHTALLLAQSRTNHVAAHQVVMQIWWFLSFFSSPVAMIAQALLPKEVAAKNTKQSNLLTNILLKLGFVVATVMTAIVSYISYFHSELFSSAIDIRKLAQSVALQSSFSQFIICMTTALDGLFIGTDSLLPVYVQASFVSTAAAWVYFAYAISRGLGLVGAWNGLAVFGAVRLVYYLTQWRKYINVINDKQDNSSNYNDNGSGTL